MKQKPQHTERPNDAVALPILSLADRIKISDGIRAVAARTTAMNPVHPECMVLVVDFLDMGELVSAIEFFFQAILNPGDWLIDVRLHDLIYVLSVSDLLGGPHCMLKSFECLRDEVLKVYM